MDAFVRDAEAGRHLEAGWPDTRYDVLRAGLTWPARASAAHKPKRRGDRGGPRWASGGRSLGRPDEALMRH